MPLQNNRLWVKHRSVNSNQGLLVNCVAGFKFSIKIYIWIALWTTIRLAIHKFIHKFDLGCEYVDILELARKGMYLLHRYGSANMSTDYNHHGYCSIWSSQRILYGAITLQLTHSVIGSSNGHHTDAHNYSLSIGLSLSRSPLSLTLLNHISHSLFHTFYIHLSSCYIWLFLINY